jgi:hypothetical protein
MNIALYNASPPLLSSCHSGHVAELLAHSFNRRGDADIANVLQYRKIRREYRQSRLYEAEEMTAIERIERPMIYHYH